MAAPIRASHRLQFRLRTLLAGVTLLILLGNGFLIWRRAPFEVEGRTNSPAWRHLPLLKREARQQLLAAWQAAKRSGDRNRIQALAAAGAAPPKFIFREKRRVYRTLRGECVNHGPLEVFDVERRRLRVEHWSHGKLHGPWVDYDLEGAPFAWGEYRHGRMHGRWRTRENSDFDCYQQVHYDNGSRIVSEDYRHEQRYMRRRYDGSGVLVEEKRWRDLDPPAVMIECTRYASDASGGLRPVMEGRWIRGGTSFQLSGGDGGGGVDQFIAALRFDNGATINGQEASLSKLRQALNSPTSLRFRESGLDEAIAFTASLHEIPLRLDTLAFRRSRIDPGRTITVDFDEGLPLHLTLKSLAAELSLTCELQNGELLLA
ncbi:MAG: hypothetical protein KY475_21335, partial [Planctomycetes bacterium]|nr:hypothetical protein [Planctomycetota bacterium]